MSGIVSHVVRNGTPASLSCQCVNLLPTPHIPTHGDIYCKWCKANKFKSMLVIDIKA
ncbi:hypothetical protein PAXRUDRAFT_825335 [Paxillus rubicundulus Ve08.2h10]|uniref:Uncharacterized protein n=1 Tax=Paxillus rubicundulus Ve08.2h10 TaxID=930991 RepID=A0A0D0DGH8_9AGAM|nr:hypothetical protein PAXRUDRAFT_825335 [Paxillus rubicundulus Ve08.2h10]